MNPAVPPLPVGPESETPLMSRLRNYLLAGALVTASIAITLYVTWWLVDYVDAAVTGLLPDVINPRTYVDVPGVGIILLAGFLILVGFLTANYLGRMALRIGERIVGRMPVVR